MYCLVLVMENLAQSLHVWSTCDSVSKLPLRININYIFLTNAVITKSVKQTNNRFPISSDLRAAPCKYRLWDAGLEKSDFLILCHRKASVPLMTEIRILVWPGWYFQCARIFMFRPATRLKMQLENSVNFWGLRGISQSHTQQMSPYYGGHAFFEFTATFWGIQLSTGIFDRFLHIYPTKGGKKGTLAQNGKSHHVTFVKSQ